MVSRALGDLTPLWLEETVLLFEFGVSARQGFFVEMEKTGVEAVAYVNSTLRNDSFSGRER